MRILCIGDSNTWGYNPVNGSRYERRWPKVLQKLMPESEIIEEGLNGRTVISIDAQKRELCGMESLKMILMSHKPVDCIILMLGTNEFKRIFNCGAKYIAAGIREYIKIINNQFTWDNYKIPELLVISPVLLGEDIAEKEGPYGDFNEDSLVQSKYLSKAIGDVCEGYGVQFMNAADYAEACEFDSIHMDEENHEKLAQAVFERIKSMEI